MKVGKNSKINVKNLIVGDGVIIGDNCLFDCDKLTIMDKVEIGNNVKITCKEVELGSLLYTADNIIIGGGGEKGPNSEFIIGEKGYIGCDVIINTTEKVQLGNQVCVGNRAMIYTHAHWLPALEGYYNIHKEVIVEDKVWVGNNVFVLPGCRIGEGSVITVNSVVVCNVPKRSLVTGNPGKITRNYPSPLTASQQDRMIHDWIEEMGRYKRICLDTFKVDSLKLHYKKTVFDFENATISGEQTRETDEIREFLRKKGHVFGPDLWRYEHG